MGPRRGFFGRKKRKSIGETGEGSGAAHSPMQEEEEHIGAQSPQLTDNQRQRLDFLTNQRVLIPSRWFDMATLNELGLHDQVQMLTDRLGLWNFLREVVPTYKNLTIDFLSTFEFDRLEGIVSFTIGGQHFSRTTMQLMELLNLPIENDEMLNDTCTFRHDMSQAVFRRNICPPIGVNPQRARLIRHPALRYIQRTLAHTLFGRGETSSVLQKSEIFYLYCMLRRNNGEMCFMPHMGYILAKHLYHVATTHLPNGIISCGGVITKIAMALHVNVADEIVPGPTTLDIAALVHMQLLARSQNDEYWLSKGPGDYGFRLPLTTDIIDPHRLSTWELSDEPQVDLEEGPANAAPQTPLAQPQQAAATAPHDGPSNQDLMNYMVQMNQGLTNQLAEMNQTWTGQFSDVSARMETFGNQLNNITLRLYEFEEPLQRAEEDAQMARYYAQLSFEQLGIDPTDEPPTPHRERRRRHAQAEARRREFVSPRPQGGQPPDNQQ